MVAALTCRRRRRSPLRSRPTVSEETDRFAPPRRSPSAAAPSRSFRRQAHLRPRVHISYSSRHTSPTVIRRPCSSCSEAHISYSSITPVRQGISFSMLHIYKFICVVKLYSGLHFICVVKLYLQIQFIVIHLHSTVSAFFILFNVVYKYSLN